MRVYLAGGDSRRADLRTYAERLKEAGHEIVSSWIYMPDDDFDTGNRAGLAIQDIRDLDGCDALVLFTVGGRKGGKDFEAGYAYAKGKRVIVVGPFTHVFTYLKEVPVLNLDPLPHRPEGDIVEVVDKLLFYLGDGS